MLRNTLLLLAATATLLPAQDDRDRTTPTGAIWNSGQSSAELTTLVNQGWRLTDIEIESTSPFSFTVSMVPNSGAYAKAWWYAVGVTATQLGATLTQNSARLIDLEPYDDNGTLRFVAVMVSNTGADQKGWWWGYGMTSTQISSSLTTNNARLTSLKRYTIGGTTRFAVVMISNTGADYRNWGYLYSATSAQINQNLTQYGNRLYGIERISADSYDAIMVPSASTGNWYYFELTGSQLTEVLQQNIGRLVDVERHLVSGSSRYTAILLDNANTLEKRARQAFYAAPSNALGDFGFYLKEHPLDTYSGTLESLKVVKARDVENLTADQCAKPIRMAGTMQEKRERVGKRGNKYAFVKFQDATGSFECMMWSEVLSASRELLDGESAVLLTLDAQLENGKVRLICTRADDLEKAAAARVRNLELHVSPELTPSELSGLLSADGRGNGKIVVVTRQNGHFITVALPDRYAIQPKTLTGLREMHGVTDIREF